MLRKVAICALMATAVLAVGCGSSGDKDSDADEQQIRELVDNVNQATQDKDASAFCLLIQPSAVKETFHEIDRCVNETATILEQVGEQPKLELESVEVDGDTAKVRFSGKSGGETTLTREDGQWFLPLSTSEAAQSNESSSSEEGQ